MLYQLVGNIKELTVEMSGCIRVKFYVQSYLKTQNGCKSVAYDEKCSTIEVSEDIEFLIPTYASNKELLGLILFRGNRVAIDFEIENGKYIIKNATVCNG